VDSCIVYAMVDRGRVLGLSVSAVCGIFAGRQRGGGASCAQEQWSSYILYPWPKML
jgi:hypothetical protein